MRVYLIGRYCKGLTVWIGEELKSLSVFVRVGQEFVQSVLSQGIFVHVISNTAGDKL